MGVFYPVVWFFGPGGGGVRPSGCGRPARGVCACVRSEQPSPPLSLCFPVACSVPRFKLKQAGEEEDFLISEWRMRRRLTGGPLCIEQRGSSYTLPLKCHFETETFLLVLKPVCRLCRLCDKEIFLQSFVDAVPSLVCHDLRVQTPELFSSGGWFCCFQG